MSGVTREAAGRLIEVSTLAGRDRYHLLTSLVVPRPIGWVATRSANGTRNLAPFSYFAGVSVRPVLVSVSIGSRGGVAKDTLRNIRETGAFCVNVVTERHLEAMNLTSGAHQPGVDEFEVAGLEAADAALVPAPYVADCPAVLECRLFREVDLGDSPNTLVLGEVKAVRLAEDLAFVPGTHLLDPEALRPVGRLGGERYALMGEMPSIPRPVVGS